MILNVDKFYREMIRIQIIRSIKSIEEIFNEFKQDYPVSPIPQSAAWYLLRRTLENRYYKQWFIDHFYRDSAEGYYLYQFLVRRGIAALFEGKI